MSVYELTREQLDELKSAFFWGEDTANLVPEDVWSEDQISDALIFRYFENTEFVDDDFLSSCGPIALPF